jgi:hypothetical protein
MSSPDHLILDSRRARGRSHARARLGAIVTARIDRFIAEGGEGTYMDME